MKIEGVKNDDIELPEKITASLLSIYPTIFQENVVNADITADFLDRYRFFFNYIFLPFDNDSENDWAKKNLIPRIQLFFDLNNLKTISKGMSSYIRQLIEEAKYIQDKRELLEKSIENGNESYENLDLSREDSKETAGKLLLLYLRMNQIKNEFELLSNPEMREVYESIKFPSKDITMKKKIYVVNKEGSINDQIQLLEKLKSKIDPHDKIHWMQCLNVAIEQAGPLSQIYIPSGNHSLKFLEYLHDNIIICGLYDIENDINLNNLENYAIIRANDLSSMLFAINGDVKFKNLVIDCSNTNVGFIIKNGSRMVSLENCVIFGLKSASDAFNISGEASLYLENCLICNFGTAFDVANSKLKLINCVIKQCGTGIVMDDNSSITIENSKLIEIKECALVKYIKHEENKEQKTLLTTDDKIELEKINIMISENTQIAAKTQIKVITKLAEDSITEFME